MNILQFMSENPILTFILVVIVSESIIRIAIVLPNRILRHMNIRKHGYPPVHCDADGDLSLYSPEEFERNFEKVE